MGCWSITGSICHLYPSGPVKVMHVSCLSSIRSLAGVERTNHEAIALPPLPPPKLRHVSIMNYFTNRGYPNLIKIIKSADRLIIYTYCTKCRWWWLQMKLKSKFLQIGQCHMQTAWQRTTGKIQNTQNKTRICIYSAYYAISNHQN